MGGGGDGGGKQLHLHIWGTSLQLLLDWGTLENMEEIRKVIKGLVHPNYKKYFLL